MVRQIIQIDEELCNGCGACANACHEGAIQMIDGKAKLIRDDYCDGLGNCLPACPTGAISFVEREAAAYDEKAVEEHQKKMAAQKQTASENRDFMAAPDQGCVPWYRRIMMQGQRIPLTHRHTGSHVLDSGRARLSLFP